MQLLALRTTIAGSVALAILAMGLPASAQVDIHAVRASLRTARGTGGEVPSPRLGQEVYVHVDYEVTGAENVTADIRATLDGTSRCSGPIQFAEQGAVWCEAVFAATAGTHTLRWEIDPDNDVAELNEGNNVVEFTFTTDAAPMVDLRAERTYFRTQANGGTEVAGPALGQQVYAHVDYRVVGTTNTLREQIRAFVDDTELCAGLVAFSGESTVSCTTSWTATAGMHSVRWELDPDGALAETNEGNNVSQLIFTTGVVPSVDLQAVRAYFTSEPGGGDEVASPEPGQDVYAHIDYRVTGNNGPVLTQIEAVIDDAELCAGAEALNGEGNVYCQGPWTATEGMHTLRWQIDTENSVPEANENNNVAERRFTTGASACTGDCNGDGMVGINELVIGVNIVLETQEVDACPAFDPNDNGRATIDELVAAVVNALGECA